MNVLLWNTEKVLKKDGKWIQKLTKLLGRFFMPLDHYVRLLVLHLFIQHSPSPKISLPNFKTQTNNVGSSTGQRGEEKKTYAGRRSQTETREEKVGYCGTELKLLAFFIYNNFSTNTPLFYERLSLQ